MQVIELPGPRTELQSVCFAPDGRLLAARGFGQVFLIDTVTGAVRVLFRAKSAYALGAAAVAFTADGSGVLVQHDWSLQNEVWVLDSGTAQVVTQRSLNPTDSYEPGPGGRCVYLVVRPGGKRTARLVRWDPLTGKEAVVLDQQRNGIDGLAVSADERWAAVASPGAVHLWPINARQVPRQAARKLTVERTSAVALALSADGAYLAVGSRHEAAGTLFLADTRTGDTHRIGDRTGDSHRDVAFHPTHPILAHRGASGEAVLYDAAVRAELSRFAWGAGGLTAVAFSPDGLRCAAAGPGKVVVWDVDL